LEEHFTESLVEDSQYFALNTFQRYHLPKSKVQLDVSPKFAFALEF